MTIRSPNALGLPVCALASAATNFTLDGASDKAAWLFQMEKAALISEVGVVVSSVTGTSPTYKIGLQGVDTAGDPDGTYLNDGGGEASATSAAWSGTLAMNNVTLTNDYSATRGQLMALVMEYSSGTIDASNNVAVRLGTSWPGANANTFPKTQDNTGAGWNENTLRQPQWRLADAGGAVYGNPLEFIASQTIAANNEYGMRFKLDAADVSAFTVRGVRFSGGYSVSDNLALSLWDTSRNLLQQVEIDGSVQANSGASRENIIYFDEATLSSLAGDTEYFVGIHGQSNNLFLEYVNVNAAADLDTLVGSMGSDWYLVNRGVTYLQGSGGGAFTTTLTRCPLMQLLIEDWTAPTAGGLAKLVGPGGGLVG